ncbi:MAG: FecR family protein, partial [Bdellovibrionota bacterium]|nr:FecR family protein [Bdellovibrionota bacterium]
MKKFIFLMVFYTLTPSFLWGEEHIAEAIIVRGKVTILELGDLKAKVVKRGAKFKKDASILTGPRSFIRIRFLDKSIASLGPNSKMVVNQGGKKRASIISLIKGKLRTKVIKKISKKSQGEESHSLYIKTVTASLGVRGTDFQVLYNKKNKVTSLLTYEGKVQISKNETRPEGLSNKTDQAILEEQTKRMEKALNSKESVTVPKGQFSGVSPKLKKTTLPVKISPKQFTLLYKNDELKGPKSLKEITKKDYIAQAEQKAPLEGVSETASGDFAPRSGGFLDLETGLYVAPGTKSELNKKLGVYEDKTIGSLSSKTGKYIPPKGLKLDSVKGFIPDKDPKNKKEADKIKKKIKELNEGIKKQKTLLTKKVSSFLKKIKEIKLKKPEKIKNLLDPNLLPGKGEFIYGNYVGLKNYSEGHDSNSGQESIKESFMTYLGQGLTYGLTSKLSIGFLVNLYFPLSSIIYYGTGAPIGLDGVSLKQEYEFDHEGPFLSAAYKNKQGLFKFIFKPEKEKDFAAITDPNGNVLQKGSHSLKERYIS